MQIDTQLRPKRGIKAGNFNGITGLPAVLLQPHFLADFGVWGLGDGHGLDHIQKPVFRHVPQMVPFPLDC